MDDLNTTETKNYLNNGAGPANNSSSAVIAVCQNESRNIGTDSEVSNERTKVITENSACVSESSAKKRCTDYAENNVSALETDNFVTKTSDVITTSVDGFQKSVLSDAFIAALLSENSSDSKYVSEKNHTETSMCVKETDISIQLSANLNGTESLASGFNGHSDSGNCFNEESPESLSDMTQEIILKVVEAVEKQTDDISKSDTVNGYRCESESWSEDESSSSTSSDSSSVCSDSFLDKMHENHFPKKVIPKIKTKGEIDLDELPPIEELNISVGENEMKKIGLIYAIVDKLVIVRALKDLQPLDLDSVLFLSNEKTLGRIFDVFGPVIEPFYSVRFNSTQHVLDTGVVVDLDVFFAPEKNEITSYVFVDQLLNQKGSDASWKDNNEPPETCLDYSDDEQERNAKRKRQAKNRKRPDDDNDVIIIPKVPTQDGLGTPSAFIPPPRPAPVNKNTVSHFQSNRFSRPNSFSSQPVPLSFGSRSLSNTRSVFTSNYPSVQTSNFRPVLNVSPVPGSNFHPASTASFNSLSSGSRFVASSTSNITSPNFTFVSSLNVQNPFHTATPALLRSPDPFIRSPSPNLYFPPQSPHTPSPNLYYPPQSPPQTQFNLSAQQQTIPHQTFYPILQQRPHIFGQMPSLCPTNRALPSPSAFPLQIVRPPPTLIPMPLRSPVSIQTNYFNQNVNNPLSPTLLSTSPSFGSHTSANFNSQWYQGPPVRMLSPRNRQLSPNSPLSVQIPSSSSSQSVSLPGHTYSAFHSASPQELGRGSSENFNFSSNFRRF